MCFCLTASVQLFFKKQMNIYLTPEILFLFLVQTKNTEQRVSGRADWSQVQVLILSSHRHRVKLTVWDRGGSYQYDGADGVGGQDVILQGSAVTLGLHVRGALVMELEEVRQPSWCQYKRFKVHTARLFILHHMVVVVFGGVFH